MDEDILRIAKEDKLGKSLQDLTLKNREHASKKEMKKLLVYADFDWLKSGIETATFIKQVFATPFEKVETSTINASYE